MGSGVAGAVVTSGEQASLLLRTQVAAFVRCRTRVCLVLSRGFFRSQSDCFARQVLIDNAYTDPRFDFTTDRRSGARSQVASLTLLIALSRSLSLVNGVLCAHLLNQLGYYPFCITYQVL